MSEITIPYKFTPRDYQLAFLREIDKGTKRIFILWHRKAGKDKLFFNGLVKKAVEKVGNYAYFLPTYEQAKKVIWNMIDNDGFKFLDHVPNEIIKAKNNSELKIELITGSTIQLIGTDDIDRIRGINPQGCVFSEYAFHNPMAWEVIRPILAVNNGFAWFNTTPNGKNHAYDLWKSVQENSDWFTQKLSITDTGIITKEYIQKERQEGMSEEMIQQEYYCSFDVGALGSIFAERMVKAWNDKRITSLPTMSQVEVDLYFDLGISKGNETAIWFVQKKGEWLYLINHYENSNKGFEFFTNYIDEYIEKFKLKLGTIYLPHDAAKRDFVTMNNVLQAFTQKYGSHKVKRLEPISRQDQGALNKAREIIDRCKFDVDNCKQGIKALENYQYEYDDVKKVFRTTPRHDWASNSSDAFIYFANNQIEKKPESKIKIISYTKNLEKACKF